MPYAVPTHRPHPLAPRDHRWYDKHARNKDANSFYHGATWLKLRMMKLHRDPCCEACLADQRITQATHVHHIKPIGTHMELAYDMNNLQSLCHSCHSRTHAHIRENLPGNPK